MDSFTLNNGMKVPCIANGPMVLGYGKGYPKTLFGRVWRKLFSEPIQSRNYIHAVSESIKMGFNWIDYSSSYGDGSLIRKAIKDSGVKRSNLLLTARVSNHEQVYKDIRECVELQMKGLGTEYIDVLMFHLPVPEYCVKTWKQFENLYEEGIGRSIGVANCHQHHIEKILNVCNVPPMLNQIEVHPLFSQKELINYCKSMNIQVQAYTPIARYDDRLMRLTKLRAIGAKYNKSIPQVILKWHIMGGVIPVIRSMNVNHLQNNIDIFDFDLTNEEFAYIDSININSRLRFDPDNCDFSIL